MRGSMSKFRAAYIVFCLLCIPGFARAQLLHNSFYIEGYIHGISLFSAGYERCVNFKNDSLLHLSFYSGVERAESDFDHKSIYCLPLKSTLLIGNRSDFAEIGLGYVLGVGTSNIDSNIIPATYKTNVYHTYNCMLGYRHVMRDHILLRVSPIISFTKDPPLGSKFISKLSLGFSFGYSW